MSTFAPTARAAATNASTGTTVPSAFETWATAMSFVRSLSRSGKVVQADLAGIVDRHHPQPGADLVSQQLPRNDVGVVLEVGDDDLVARADVGPPPGLRDEVDRLGRATCRTRSRRARRR